MTKEGLPNHKYMSMNIPACSALPDLVDRSSVKPLPFLGAHMAQVTQADLIRHCKDFQDQHGIIALLSILEDIIECQAQASGVVLLDDDADEMETAYFTVQ